MYFLLVSTTRLNRSKNRTRKFTNNLFPGLSSFVLAYATIEQLIIVMDYYYKSESHSRNLFLES